MASTQTVADHVAVRPLRVLHVITRFLDAGTERNLASHIRLQQEWGVDVALAVGGEHDPEGVPDVPIEIIPTLRRAPHPIDDLRAYRALRRIIGNGEFDVVHTHQSKAGVLGRLAARGRATTVHTVHMASFGSGYSSFGSMAFLAAERVAARFTDLLVSVGTDLRDQYLEAGVGDAQRFLVVRSELGLGRYRAVRRERDRRRAEPSRGAGSLGPVLLSVGALEPRKRHALIIDRLAPLLRRGGVLLIAGAGPEAAALRRLAEALGVSHAVRLIGQVDAIDERMASADVLVHASAAEGVPQVVIQALAAGLPVVATDVTGLRELPAAPIVIVDREGRDLEGAIEQTLADPPAPVAEAQLAQWVGPISGPPDVRATVRSGSPRGRATACVSRCPRRSDKACVRSDRI